MRALLFSACVVFWAALAVILLAGCGIGAELLP